MTVNELDAYFSKYLALDTFSTDVSKNGLQAANNDPDTAPVQKIAFGVDAGLETITRSAQAGAGLLFVHHGLLWGQCEPITGVYYRRLKALFDADMALYACHLPLDAHPVSGNNYGLAARLGLQNQVPFGSYHGALIGVRGDLPEGAALTPEELARRLFPGNFADCKIFPFGKTRIRSAAIVSGGAGDLVDQAAVAGVDAYITGEVEHQTYHLMKEMGITVIAGGHYVTETVGVSLMMKKTADDLGLETVFIDVPTGM
jgi:dinuclear metal center YbgI/SA1388 family protein